jgi:hypothetical protein
MKQQTVARAQGAFNIVTGLWPWVSMQTFELVLGPKVDHWLVRAVANLLIVTGIAEVTTPDDPAALRQTRKAGIGVAAALTAIDAIYVPRRRISRMYVLDAAGHLFWIAAWLAAARRERS